MYLLIRLIPTDERSSTVPDYTRVLSPVHFAELAISVSAPE